MSTSPDQLLGKVLDGRYQLDSILAKGGMATVFFATDMRLHRQVAVKVMHSNLAEDLDFVRRFEQEARAAASLTHQHVVAVHDQGNDQAANAIYLVMELVAGHTVRELLSERGPLTAIQSLAVMDPLLQALIAAHEAGFVHRDIKPENIIIGDNGRIKVTDFGLARAISSTQSMATTRGLLIGTVAYLSPEQVEQGKATERSDIYSAGIVLFEMLTGRLPHGGDTPIAVAFQHVHADIPKPSKIKTDVPNEMDYLVLKATARDPQKRFKTADEFLDAVRKTREYLENGGNRSALITDALDESNSNDTVILHKPDSADEESDVSTSTLVIKKPKKSRKFATLILIMGLIASSYFYWAGTQTKVPPLVGLTKSQAQESLANMQLKSEAKLVFSEVVPAGVVISANPASGSSISKSSVVLITVSKGPEYFSVPNMLGFTLDEVRSSLEEIGLKLGDVAYEYSSDVKKNLVISSEPGFGEPAKPNSAINIVLSKGVEPIAVPEVVGLTELEAIARLNDLGFMSVTIIKEFSNTVATGVVIAQAPNASTLHLPKTTLTLTVSKGIKPVTVPSIIGLSKAAAITTLTNAELSYEIIGSTTCNNGYKKNSRKVSQQSVVAGNKVAPGTVVGFVITAICKN